jgi:ATP-dependent protease ClpP protease subunit
MLDGLFFTLHNNHMKKLRWSGDIGWRNEELKTGITVAFVENELMNAGGDDISVELDSMGGDFFVGIQIMTMLKSYPAKKTVFYGSIVASAGTVVALGFDERISRKTTSFMIHNAKSGEWGDQNDLRKMADQLDSWSAMIADEYVRITGKSLQEIKVLMDAETWLFGQKIVDNGFAEKMDNIDAPGDISTMDQAISMYKKLKVKNHADFHRPETVREFEGFLRDAGFSKIQATAIASVGFRAGSEKIEEATKVTKEEILAAVKETPGIDLREIAVSMSAENLLSDPKIAQENAALKEQLAAVESDRVRMALDKEFGSAGKVRVYADKCFPTLMSITVEALAAFRSDEIAKALAAQEVDHTSVENRVSDPKDKGIDGQKIAGVPVVKV